VHALNIDLIQVIWV